MGGFFLHRRTWSEIRNRYAIIFSSAGKSNTKGPANESGIANYKTRGLIYEVTLTGAFGNLKDTEAQNLWDFFDLLGYMRTQDYFRYLSLKAK